MGLGMDISTTGPRISLYFPLLLLSTGKGFPRAVCKLFLEVTRVVLSQQDVFSCAVCSRGDSGV